MILKLLYERLFIEAAIFIVVAVLSIMLHEIAHGYAAIKNGDLTPKIANRMNLNPVNHFDPIGFGLFLFVGFGWAKPVPVNSNNFHRYRKGLFQVSVAGVLLNFVLAFFAYPLAVVFSNLYASSGGVIVYHYLYWAFLIMFSLNLTLCVFNLLPIYPLDGFRILESRLRRMNPYIDFMYRYGTYVLIGVLMLIMFTSLDLLRFMRNVVGFPITKFWDLLLGLIF